MKIYQIVKPADIVTAANLACGVSSIFAASNNEFGFAAVLMILAIIMDTLDGKVAKMMQQVNPFGKELDSLADLISFGLAPAFLYYALKQPGMAITLILLLFVVCGMFRLARYNISKGEGFEGVPITVNGFIFPVLYLLYIYVPETIVIWPVIYATMSVLMISSFKLKRII